MTAGQSTIQAQVSLTLPSTANITTEELQSVEVKVGLQTQLAAAIGIDVQYVTITAIYLCPGDNRCTTTTRRLMRELNTEGVRIVVEFMVAASEEIIQQAEAGMANTDNFQETMSTGASTSLSQTLNKDITVTASAPMTTSRTVGSPTPAPEAIGLDTDQSVPGTSTSMPTWFIPVVASAGGLTLVLLVAGLVLRTRNNAKKAIQPYEEDSLSKSQQSSSSSPKKKKKKRGRATGTNFDDLSATPKGKRKGSSQKKNSPYSVPEPAKVVQSAAGNSPRSPYAVASKEENTPNSKTKKESPRSPYSFSPGPTSSSKKNESNTEEIKTPTNRRPLPKLRSKSRPSPIASGSAVIGPGSPVALPSPSAVNRYRAFQAEKKKKMEIRRKQKEEKAARLAAMEEADGDDDGAATGRPKRSRSVSPGRMTKEEKSNMLEQYKVAHKRMYSSVKERLKAQHLERLQKLAALKKEEERLRSPQASPSAASSLTTSSTPTGAAADSASATATATATTTEIAVDAASAGVGTVSAKSKQNMMAAAQPKSATRKEVLDGYKAEHRRLRAQMKAKLKSEYMARLKAERAKKNKDNKASSKIEGEGKTK